MLIINLIVIDESVIEGKIDVNYPDFFDYKCRHGYLHYFRVDT